MPVALLRLLVAWLGATAEASPARAATLRCARTHARWPGEGVSLSIVRSKTGQQARGANVCVGVVPGNGVSTAHMVLT
ncbi:hypothetical protein TSOC_010258 [Tetrabaena socialis]|uniref:Uncharacterized protein n=1 Tax=Tetrabaena socialis TaxID=47790 RepID=A0A2J7ZTU9_9CHLO|nr:hypothetical protein TSOC_010258 [Tetrabaena socialis]|eukprot:PNH03660.1 hypothetical protein TSOC_010258 [Tetrabaena socialis]